MDWIRACFPGSSATAPGDAYARIRHPVRRDSDEIPFDHLAGDPLFFDLETLGFLGHPVFLVGLLRRSPRRDQWEVIQLLARDYTEEEAILTAFGRYGRRASIWVSFNGKTFDLPFLQRRAAFYRMTLPQPGEHIDLLPRTRRIYRGVLPDCRLQTLEMRLFGRYRTRDLPGSEIPAAYHEFVRGGDPEAMGRILRHNRNDLVTLARLLAHLEEAS